ncbi:hypothetical protein Tco_0123507 [Tanacetum coccineum]
MKMEFLLEPTSNKLMVEHAEFDESDTHVLERFDTSAENPVKEILLKLNLPDHRIFKDGGEEALNVRIHVTTERSWSGILELPRQDWLLKNLSMGFKAVTTARFKAVTTASFTTVTTARV